MYNYANLILMVIIKKFNDMLNTLYKYIFLYKSYFYMSHCTMSAKQIISIVYFYHTQTVQHSAVLLMKF